MTPNLATALRELGFSSVTNGRWYDRGTVRVRETDGTIFVQVFAGKIGTTLAFSMQFTDAPDAVVIAAVGAVVS